MTHANDRNMCVPTLHVLPQGHVVEVPHVGRGQEHRDARTLVPVGGTQQALAAHRRRHH